MQVHGLPPSLLAPSSSSAEYLCQAPGVVHSQDVDVILTAEGLNEGEVNLKGYVFHIFVVRGQDAQNHIIRITRWLKKESVKSVHFSALPFCKCLKVCKASY